MASLNALECLHNENDKLRFLVSHLRLSYEARDLLRWP